MPRPSDLIQVAKGEVGYSRWADPEQGTKYGRWYAGITGSPYYGESGVPYCAMFVSWCLDRAGVACEGFPRAVAIDRRDGFNRMLEAAAADGGDVIGFDWDSDHTGDHVGIVTQRTGDYVTISTIEGNTGYGEVKECVRSISQCTIAVRPYYDESESPAKQDGRLDVDGIAGPNTVRYWQEQLATPVDGEVSDQYAENDRYRRNVWAIAHGGGYYGSALVRAIQRRVGADPDGQWGEDTTMQTQALLKHWGYYGGDLDGDFGHHSVVALQRSLNDRRWTA